MFNNRIAKTQKNPETVSLENNLAEMLQIQNLFQHISLIKKLYFPFPQI